MQVLRKTVGLVIRPVVGLVRPLGARTISKGSEEVPTDVTAGSRFKIYTKTGDKGTSSLYNGNRSAKDDAIFMALGDTDDLNNAIGVAGEFCKENAKVKDISAQLAEIQSRLFDVGSAVATPKDTTKSKFKLERAVFDATAVLKVEGWIDAMMRSCHH